MSEKWESFKKRLRVKYRVAVINDKTLGEVLHVRLSLLNLLLAFVAFLVISLIVFSLLIISTPLRNYLPGYNESLKQRLALQTYRVDSLQQEMALQTAYLDMIHDVVAGEMSIDSVTRPDSVISEKIALDTTTSSATAAFIEQYEAKGRENIGLFDAYATQPVLTLFRPAHGVVSDKFSPHTGNYGVVLTTAAGANVTSVLSGTVVYATYIIYEGWTIMIQHDGDYLSVYHGVEKPMKQVGASLQAGETIGLVQKDGQLGFELWQHGNAMDPESVIAF